MLECLLKWIEAHPGLAAWVQAIGAIGAILVAVWVSHHQIKKQQDRDRLHEHDEVQGMLLSLRGEIETLMHGIDSKVGQMLSQSPRGSIFNVRYPIAEHPFVIYNCLIQKLGMIPDHQLRNKIIFTYAQGQGLVLTFRFNNELINQCAAATILANKTGHTGDIKAAQDALTMATIYGDALRDSYEEVKAHVAALLKALPAA